jgi:hypothetical protein
MHRPATLAALVAVLVTGCSGVAASPEASSPSPSAPSAASATTASPTPVATAKPTMVVSVTPSPRIEAGWDATGEMITPRTAHTATLLASGDVLVAGGLVQDLVPEAERYHPMTGTWTATAPLQRGRYGHSATLLPNGTVLVAGGFSTDDDALPSASAELYDPDSETWGPTASMASVRAGHTATLLPDGTVLVTGGASYNGGNGSPLDTVERYDPVDGSWSAVRPMIHARAAHTATLLPDGRVFVVGGVGTDTEEVAPMNTTLQSAEMYDPASGAWTVMASMAEGHAKHIATLLPDRKVVIWGQGADASAAVYDVERGSWAAMGSATDAFSVHAAMLLPDGTLLTIPGYGANESAVAVEMSDPAIGSWTVTPTMIVPRYDWSATLLIDGSVLVAGGMDGAGSHVAPAERYESGGIR